MMGHTVRCWGMIFWLFAASASTRELADPPHHRHGGEPLLRSDGAFLVYVAQRKVRNILDPEGDETRPLRNPETRDSGLAAALARAWKRDFITDGIAATRTMLIDCQRETSVVLSTALMRSDPQQAHCFRF